LDIFCEDANIITQNEDHLDTKFLFQISIKSMGLDFRSRNFISWSFFDPIQKRMHNFILVLQKVSNLCQYSLSLNSGKIISNLLGLIFNISCQDHYLLDVPSFFWFLQ
jgi:hypothetical protein